MKPFLAFLLLGLMVTVGFGQKSRWEYVANSDESLFYLDTSSRTVVNGHIRIWERRVSLSSKIIKILLSEYDCEQKRRRLLQITTYDTNDNADTVFSGQSQWTYVVPDSIGESMLKIVCRQPPPAKEKSKGTIAFAEILSDDTYLYEAANFKSNPILLLPAGLKLKLINPKAPGPWYKIYEPKHKKYGWLHGNAFQIVYQ